MIIEEVDFVKKWDRERMEAEGIGLSDFGYRCACEAQEKVDNLHRIIEALKAQNTGEKS
jgi:hypothetical protein